MVCQGLRGNRVIIGKNSHPGPVLKFSRQVGQNERQPRTTQGIESGPVVLEEDVVPGFFRQVDQADIAPLGAESGLPRRFELSQKGIHFERISSAGLGAGGLQSQQMERNILLRRMSGQVRLGLNLGRVESLRLRHRRETLTSVSRIRPAGQKEKGPW